MLFEPIKTCRLCKNDQLIEFFNLGYHSLSELVDWTIGQDELRQLEKSKILDEAAPYDAFIKRVEKIGDHIDEFLKNTKKEKEKYDI